MQCPPAKRATPALVVATRAAERRSCPHDSPSPQRWSTRSEEQQQGVEHETYDGPRAQSTPPPGLRPGVLQDPGLVRHRWPIPRPTSSMAVPSPSSYSAPGSQEESGGGCGGGAGRAGGACCGGGAAAWGAPASLVHGQGCGEEEGEEEEEEEAEDEDEDSLAPV